MADQSVISVIIEVQIGGVPVPTHGWSVHGTSKGHGGSATLETNTVALAQKNIDLVNMAIAAGAAGLPVDIFVTMQSTRYHVFGGQYVSPTFDYDTGDISISCRDWASVLQDKRSVFNTQNKPLNAVWSDVAGAYGLSPDVQADSSDNPDIGTIYGSQDTAWGPMPQTPWALVQKLARNNGYEAYVSPDKKLVLALPGTGSTLKLAYQMNPLPAGAVPCDKLKFSHNALRNSNFAVRVSSYHPQLAQVTQGDATAGKPGKQRYLYHKDGMTAAQAQQKANSIATDIAKKGIAMSCEIDFLPTLLPMQAVSIDGPTIHSVFRSQPYSIAAYSHRFKMSHGEGVSTLDTSLSCELAVNTKSGASTAGSSSGGATTGTPGTVAPAYAGVAKPDVGDGADTSDGEEEL